jgi:hypothetical protein
MVGTRVCYLHGGKSPAVQDKVQRAKVAIGLARLVTPIDEHDIEADPIKSFEVEFRRTIAAIRYYEAKLVEITDEKDLIWGKTREDFKTATEFAGVDETYEAKIHLYEERRFQERRHLLDLQKLWVVAKLGERKLAIEQTTVDALVGAMNAVIVGMNANPNDPSVRAIVRQAIEDAANHRPPAIEA